MEDIKDVVKLLYTVNLKVKSNESILVFVDVPKEVSPYRKELIEIAEYVANIGEEFGRTTFVKFDETGSHGHEPPLKLWKVAFGEKTIQSLQQLNLLNPLLEKGLTASQLEKVFETIKKAGANPSTVVIALSYFSTTHTNFRKLLIMCGARYASMPLFQKQMFFGALRVDWERTKERTIRIKELLDEAKSAHLLGPNGTNLMFDLDERGGFSDTGILENPGDFGNLPAGEAFISPRNSNGVFVIDYSLTRKLESPVRVLIRNGFAYKVEGEIQLAKTLAERFEKEPSSGNVAELGIGTNEGAKILSSILETEKILGTVHVAFGDDSTIGGNVRSNYHEDYILVEPILKLFFRDGSEKVILENGNLKV